MGGSRYPYNSDTETPVYCWYKHKNVIFFKIWYSATNACINRMWQHGFSSYDIARLTKADEKLLTKINYFSGIDWLGQHWFAVCWTSEASRHRNSWSAPSDPNSGALASVPIRMGFRRRNHGFDRIGSARRVRAVFCFWHSTLSRISSPSKEDESDHSILQLQPENNSIYQVLLTPL